MLTVLLSWIIIFIITLILGYGIVELLYKESRQYVSSIDVYLVMGIVMVNVYAEMFSVFYKVKALACMFLFVLGVVLVVIYYVLGRKGLMKWEKIHISNYQWLLLICIILATAAWTTGFPKHYDTGLYHNQAIQWIEKYGVVPGLGNLHNRFAYNSAFMPLQALFSLEWLTERSLHTVNGYVCCLFLAYAILSCSFWRRKSIVLSDLFKFTVLIYVYDIREIISSPSTDILAMALILYVCIKWCEFVEGEVDDALPYTMLSVICVYLVTVKLSVACSVLLAVYPAVLLLKRKKWKDIAINIVLGLVIIIPWLVRNVMISGYLVYPYPQIDLFKVDWKMPASVLTYDSREIMVWGRGMMDVADFDMKIGEWFPIWFEQQEWKELIIVGLLASVTVLILRSIKFLKEKKIYAAWDILLCYSAVTLVVWLYSSPLMRYGMVYLLIPICLCGGGLLETIKKSYKIQKFIRVVVPMLLLPFFITYTVKIGNVSSWYRQENYAWNLTQEKEIENGVKIWLTEGSDQSSYDVFPCIPYEGMLERIELRGETLEDGFKVKDIYKDLRLKNDGNEWR